MKTRSVCVSRISSWGETSQRFSGVTLTTSRGQEVACVIAHLLRLLQITQYRNIPVVSLQGNLIGFIQSIFCLVEHERHFCFLVWKKLLECFFILIYSYFRMEKKSQKSLNCFSYDIKWSFELWNFTFLWCFSWIKTQLSHICVSTRSKTELIIANTQLSAIKVSIFIQMFLF